MTTHNDGAYPEYFLDPLVPHGFISFGFAGGLGPPLMGYIATEDYNDKIRPPVPFADQLRDASYISSHAREGNRR